MAHSDFESLLIQSKLSEGILASRVDIQGKTQKVVFVGGVPLDFLTFSYFVTKVVAGRPRAPSEVLAHLVLFWEKVDFKPEDPKTMTNTSRASEYLYTVVGKARATMAEMEGKPEYDFLPMLKAVHTAFASE